MDDKKKEERKKRKEESEMRKAEKPVTVHITNHNTFQKGVGAFVTNLNHLTIVMDSEGNMKMDASQVPTMPHTQVDTEEDPAQDDGAGDSSAYVAKCFKFANDYVKQKLKTIVSNHYQGIAANLALIEVTLFDHNLLNKRNAHTALLKALMAWDVIGQLSDEELKKTTNGMANKLGFLPSVGYMEWNDKSYVNDKKTCMDIGKDLGATMPYSRKKEE